MGGREFTATICYRASTDGDQAKDFHAKCDGKELTVTLCRSENGVCFGGFTSKKLIPNSGLIEDTAAILFNLTQQRVFKVKDASKAIECIGSFGSIFGSKGALGGELSLWSPILGKNKCTSRVNG
jgi:hypothetical protein